MSIRWSSLLEPWIGTKALMGPLLSLNWLFLSEAALRFDADWTLEPNLEAPSGSAMLGSIPASSIIFALL